MDSFLDFTYLLSEPEELDVSSCDNVSSSESISVLVDAERAGTDISYSYCVIS